MNSATNNTANIVNLSAVRERQTTFKVTPSCVLIGTYRIMYMCPWLHAWKPYFVTKFGNESSHFIMDDFGTLVPVGLRVHQNNPFFLGVKLGNTQAHFES